MAKLRTALDVAEARRFTEHRGIVDAKNKYDVVSQEASTKRRRATIETTAETGDTSTQLSPLKRLQMIALCRDSQRNFSASKSMMHQIGINVIGSHFKLRIRTKHDRKNLDDPLTAAENWFNRIWAPAAEFKRGMHLAEFNKLLFQSVIREGDVGMLFDADLVKTGRLIAYEADQICTPADKEKATPKGYSWDEGILSDQYGRERGYFVTRDRGATSSLSKNGNVFPRDPLDESKNNFRLLRMPWRFGQGRGIPEIASTIADMLDLYEMRTAEHQTAKLAAAKGGAVYTDTQNFPQPGDTRVPGANDENQTSAPQRTYERMERLAGGYFEYLEKGDKIEWFNPNRPNVNFSQYYDHVVRSAGSAYGMAKAYALMQADSSYTAFRGELIMTWVTFAHWQKWCERNIRDWQAIRALNFAIKQGHIKPLPDGWEHTMSWTWPKMPSVNPLIDQQTFLAALKNGATTLADELGADWDEILEELSEELESARAKKLPLAMFETKSGGVTTGDNSTTKTDGE